MSFHSKILDDLTDPILKAQFTAFFKDYNRKDREITQLQRELYKVKEAKQSVMSTNRVLKDRLIETMRSNIIDKHNQAALDFKDKGGFNSDSYSFLSQDDDTDKLPGPVKLTPSEWSKPEGAEYGKNKDGNFMISIPIQEELNETALHKGYPENWISILNSQINSNIVEFNSSLPQIKIEIKEAIPEKSLFLQEWDILNIITESDDYDKSIASIDYARFVIINKLNEISHWNCYSHL